MAKTATSEKVLILFTSEKGGAGKSTAATAVLDYLRGSGQLVAAYDSDGAVGMLSKAFGTKADDGFAADVQNPTEGVVVYNLREDESRSMLVNSLAHGHPIVMHDLAGGGLADLMRIQDNSEGLKRLLRAIKNAGYRVVFVHLLNTDDSAVASVATYLDLIEDAGDVGEVASHVVMLNRKAGRKNAAFIDWFGVTDESGVREGGNTRERLLALGGVETELPVLDDVATAKVKRLGVPLKDAATSPKLTLSEQQHVVNFREDVADALIRAKAVLGIK